MFNLKGPLPLTELTGRLILGNRTYARLKISVGQVKMGRWGQDLPYTFLSFAHCEAALGGKRSESTAFRSEANSEDTWMLSDVYAFALNQTLLKQTEYTVYVCYVLHQNDAMIQNKYFWPQIFPQQFV